MNILRGTIWKVAGIAKSRRTEEDPMGSGLSAKKMRTFFCFRFNGVAVLVERLSSRRLNEDEREKAYVFPDRSCIRCHRNQGWNRRMSRTEIERVHRVYLVRIVNISCYSLPAIGFIGCVWSPLTDILHLNTEQRIERPNQLVLLHHSFSMTCERLTSTSLLLLFSWLSLLLFSLFALQCIHTG